MRCITILFLLTILVTRTSLAQSNKDSTAQKYGPGVLVVINEKIAGTPDSVDLNSISPDWIEKINILKDSLATAKYGNRGKHGVIEIYLKNDAPVEIKDGRIIKKESDENVKFEKVEVAPYFNGGTEAWQKFLEQHIKTKTPFENGAPYGEYKITVQYTISREGKLSDFKPLTSHGFGMEQEFIRVLKLSPDWIPCFQNGSNVNAFHKESFTFTVKEEDPDTKNKKIKRSTPPDNFPFN